MADVRSLLRQKKASRRIDHPHAAYSAAGKLLCTLCREQVKAESLWDGHLLSQGHKHRVQQKKVTQTTSTSPMPEPAPNDAVPIHKRKLEPVDEQDREMEDAVPAKRSKPDIAPLTGIAFNGTPAAAAAAAQEHAAKSGSTSTPDQVYSAGSNNSKESTKTPPSLIRRLSTTPSQGVELQIPSRPATPAHREGGSASSASASGGYFALQSQTGPVTPLHRNASAATITGPAPTAADKTSSAAQQVDESEWAAFEADIAAAEAPYDEGAVISAPAMTTEEVAAKEAADADRKAQADVDIEDEKEEATRALEDEFAEMKELEARVKSLKERRNQILKRRESQSLGTAPVKGASLAAAAVNQNGAEERVAGDEEDGDDDDDDDDEEEDDWDGFRFRT
ncbi:Coiled-coil domain-containing protein 16, partial [Metarhizium majus ARSEF 297]